MTRNTAFFEYWDCGRNRESGRVEIKYKDQADLQKKCLKEISKYFLTKEVSICNGIVYVGAQRKRMGEYKIKFKELMDGEKNV